LNSPIRYKTSQAQVIGILHTWHTKHMALYTHGIQNTWHYTPMAYKTHGIIHTWHTKHMRIGVH